MSEPLTGHNTTISIQNAGYDPRTITFDGILDDTNTLTLGDDQFLDMKGTIVTQALVATGSHGFPSMLRGIGNTIAGAGVGVASGATLRIDLTGTLDASIELRGDGDAGGDGANTAVLLLASDLVLAPGRGITAITEGGVNIVNCAGHRVTLGGFLEGPATLVGSQDWWQANLTLTGPFGIAENSVLNLVDTAYINGNGNTFTFLSGETSGFNLGNIDCTIVDTVFNNMSQNCMINTNNLHLVNCTFNDENSFQSVTITGDIVGGPLNLFSGLLVFSGPMLRLNSNVALLGAWQMRASPSLVIDLNGHTLDFAHEAAELAIVDSFMTVTIRNGRIANLSSSKIHGTVNAHYIFEDVEFILADDATFIDWVSFTFKGACSLSVAAPGITLENYSFLGVTIASGSSLTLKDGMIFAHGVPSGSFIITDSSSQLVLVGATFRRNNVEGEVAPLQLLNGVLIIDHISYLQPGNGGIQIGDGADADHNLTIEVRPSASLIIGSGGNATGGTVTYANVAEN